jgi:hypothetical protein
LLASLASLVRAVRARGLDRGRRATVSPTTALLLPLVASLLAVCLVPHCRAGMMVMSDKITMAAACWSWGLDIMNLSVVVYLTQPSSLDVLELVGKVGYAGWRGLQRHPAAQGRVACVNSGVGRLVRHVLRGEQPPRDLSHGVRIVGAGSELLG